MRWLDLTDRRRGTLLGGGGVILLSMDSLITEAADASAWDVAFWVGLWSAIALLGVAAILAPRPWARSRMEPPNRRLRPAMLASGACQTISGIAFIVAVKETEIPNVVVIIAMAPAAAAIVARLVLGEAITARVWTAIALAFAGVAVVFAGSVSAGGIGGELAAVVAVLAFALNLTIWRRHRDLSRSAAIGLGGLGMALVTAVPAQIVGLDARTMVLLVVMGGVSGPLARVGLASATRHLTAAEVSLFTPLETFSASLGAWLLFSQRPPTATWVGGAVVLTAVTVGLWPGEDSPLRTET